MKLIAPNLSCSEYMLQFRISILHSVFCTRVPKEKKKVNKKKLNNNLYSRNKSVLFALIYSCDFSHVKVSPAYITSSYNPVSCRFAFHQPQSPQLSVGAFLSLTALSPEFSDTAAQNFFFFFCIHWKIIALQCCVCFCRRTTQISHKYIPTLLNLPPTPPISQRSSQRRVWLPMLYGRTFWYLSTQYGSYCFP